MNDWIPAVAVLLPLVTSWIKRPGWSDTAKRVVAAAVAVVAGVLTVGSTQGWDLVTQVQPIIDDVLAVWVVAQTAYTHLWRDTGIEVRLAGQDPRPVPPPIP